jgi:hypothetical protein
MLSQRSITCITLPNLTGAKTSGTDATRETPIQALLNHTADFLNLVWQFPEELGTVAQNKMVDLLTPSHTAVIDVAKDHG